MTRRSRWTLAATLLLAGLGTLLIVIGTLRLHAESARPPTAGVVPLELSPTTVDGSQTEAPTVTLDSARPRSPELDGGRHHPGSADGGEQVLPIQVRIEGIDVDADILDLGLNPDGTLEVPEDYDLTGWYTGRSAPGEPGPSVIVGHVDSWRGPAVFFRLGELAVGELVHIDRSDGLVAEFRVTAVVAVGKDEFPTQLVYGPTDLPTLRLVTCGGSFDRSTKSYTENVIVFAEHVGNHPAGSVAIAGLPV